jgi:small subunit ribosomal protein S6
MEQYELLYIIPTKLEEAEKKSLMSSVDQIITQNKGVIKDHSIWLTRKLSYPIKHIRQGVFILAHANLPLEAIDKIRKELEIEENILRYLFTKVVESKVLTKVRPQRIPKILPQETILGGKYSEPVAVVAEPEEKVSLEELDKKLEELLNEESNIQ